MGPIQRSASSTALRLYRASGSLSGLHFFSSSIWKQEAYTREALRYADLVLACTDDPELNGEIYSVCKCLGIPVNVCSDRRKCDFYFPGIVARDNVVIGVTAGGTDHRKAREVREKIERLLEEEEHE